MQSEYSLVAGGVQGLRSIHPNVESLPIYRYTGQEVDIQGDISPIYRAIYRARRSRRCTGQEGGSALSLQPEPGGDVMTM